MLKVDSILFLMKKKHISNTTMNKSLILNKTYEQNEYTFEFVLTK